MIAIVKATVCRETGQVIREEVVKQVDMSRVEDSGMAEKRHFRKVPQEKQLKSIIPQGG